MHKKLSFFLGCLGLPLSASAEVSTEDAAKALQEGDLTTAKAAFTQTTITRDEDFKRALISARAYFEASEYEEAARRFEQLFQTINLPATETNRPLVGAHDTPVSVGGTFHESVTFTKETTLFYAAESYFRSLSRDKAKDLFQEFTTLYPRSAWVLRARARLSDIAQAQGDLSLAISLYQELRPLKEPFLDTSQIVYSLSRLFRQNGQEAEALTALEEVALRYPSSPAGRAAESTLQRDFQARIEGRTTQQRFQRADALFVAMQHEEACEEAKQFGTASQDKLWLVLLAKCALQEKENLKAGALFYEAATDSASLWKSISAFTSASGELRTRGYEEARKKIQELLQKYPESKEAPRAEYKAAWLDYHEAKYKEATKAFEAILQKRPTENDSRWYAGWSYFLSGDLKAALPHFEELSKEKGALVGGKGSYWAARVRESNKEKSKAETLYLNTIKEWPFSYYAQLSRLRLAALGKKVSSFGDSSTPPQIASDEFLALPEDATEEGLGVVLFWLSVGYQAEAREQLMAKAKEWSLSGAELCSLYQNAGEFKKALELFWEKPELKERPEGEVRRAWFCGYPRAHRKATESAAKERGVSPYFLWSLMRQESTYAPFLVSHANAVGLMQLLPKTASKIAQEIGAGDFFWAELYSPQKNLRLASAYVERLLKRFSGQLWLTAAAYNGGPSAVGRWLVADGSRPFDEWVEQISYSESREYLKKIAGHYARYLYVYEGNDTPIDVFFVTQNDAGIIDF